MQTLGRTNAISLCVRLIRPNPSISQMLTVQDLDVNKELPPFNADLKIWYDERAG
jgi:hypothetical protein